MLFIAVFFFQKKYACNASLITVRFQMTKQAQTTSIYYSLLFSVNSILVCLEAVTHTRSQLSTPKHMNEWMDIPAYNVKTFQWSRSLPSNLLPLPTSPLPFLFTFICAKCTARMD